MGALARVPELGLGLGLGSMPGSALVSVSGPGQELGPGPVGMDAFAELALAIVQKVTDEWIVTAYRHILFSMSALILLCYLMMQQPP